MENTLLFGNGINRLTDKNISWIEVLKQIKIPRNFEDGDLPNTLIYERIILEHPNIYSKKFSVEFNVKSKISKLLKVIQIHPFYQELYDLNIQHYLTTNYDNSFIDTIKSRKDDALNIEDASTEKIYSIRRLKKISNQDRQSKRFWQIHGEINAPKTIMLGLDHYSGSVSKIDNFIKGNYTYKRNQEEMKEPSIIDKFKTNSFSGISWIELFFTTNVHIIGFSLDYAEIDLWAIINKRARLMKGELKEKIKNEIFFYCDKITKEKEGVLKMMNIKVEVLPISDSETRYVDFYKESFDLIKSRLG